MVKIAMNIDDLMRQLASRSSVYLAFQTMAMKKGRIARKHGELSAEIREHLKSKDVQRQLIKIAREDCQKRGLDIPDPFFEQVVCFLYQLDFQTDTPSEVM